jgi:hypothetical protein
VGQTPRNSFPYSDRFVTSSAEQCPFKNEIVKGGLRPFFEIAKNAISKNDALDYLIFSFPQHLRGSKLH